MGNININVGVQLEADQKKLQNQINSLGDKLSLAIKAEKLEVGKVKIDSSKIQDAINESGKDLELKVAKIALLESALTDLQKELDAIGEKLKLDIGNVNVEEIKISQQALQNKLNSLDFNNLNLGNVSLNEITFESQEMMFKAFAKKHGIAYTESFKDSLKSALANGESITQIITSAAEDVVAKPEKAARELYKQEFERLKAFRDGIAGVANGKKLSVGEMFDKEELKELNNQLKGTLILTKDVGTYADKVMSEVIDIGARSGIEINGVLEDQIKAMAAGIQEWKNFKNNVKASDFNMYTDEYLDNVKADIDNLVISLYQASNDTKLLGDNLENVGEQIRLIGDTTSEIKKVSETVGAVDKSGGAIAFKEGLVSVEQFKQAIESVKDSMLELSGTTTKTDQYGNVTEAVINYKNELGSTITETYKLVELQDELGNKTGEWVLAFDKSSISENYDKMSRDAEKHLEKVKNLEKATDTFVKSMAKAVNYDVVDEKQLDKIQKKFSELTIDSSKTEISAVQKELDKLIDKCEEVKKVQAGMFSKINSLEVGKFVDTSKIEEFSNKINSITTSTSVSNVKELEIAINDFVGSSSKWQDTIEKSQVKMTNSLNSVYGGGLVDDGQVEKLFDRIKSLDFRTTSDELQKLLQDVNNIASSEPQIRSISETIKSVADRISELKTKSEDISLLPEEERELKALNKSYESLSKTLEDIRSGSQMTKAQLSEITKGAKEEMKLYSKESANALKLQETQAKELEKMYESMRKSEEAARKREIKEINDAGKARVQMLQKVQQAQEKLNRELSKIANAAIIDEEQVSKLQAEINKLNIDNFKDSVDELKDKLKNLASSGSAIAKSDADALKLKEKQAREMEKMYASMRKSEEAAQKEEAKRINEAGRARIKAIQEVQQAQDRLNKELAKVSGGGIVDEGYVAKLQSEINSLNIDNFKANIDELKSKVKSLVSSESSIVKIEGALSKLQSRIRELQSKSKIELLSEDESKNLNSLIYEADKLGKVLDDVRSGVSMTDAQIQKATSSATSSMKELKSATENVETSVGSLRSAFDSITNIALGTSIGNMVSNLAQDSIRGSWNVIRDIDDGLRDLKRVMGDAAINYDEFVSSANKVARGIGRTTQETILATTEFKKAGYDIELITGDMEGAAFNLQEAGLVLSNVADMSIEDSVKAIVSTLKGFGTETKDVVETANQIVDLINESGNVFAMSSQDMAEMMRIASSSLSLAGNDINEAGALMVAGFEVIQDSSKVANGLRTISMRLRGVSEDGEDLNASLGELVKTYTGVDLTDANGQFRNTYEVLSELAVALNKLEDGDPIKAMILEEVAGKNQANVLAAIVKNYQQLGNAYDTLSKSSGSAAAEQEAFIQSLSGQLNQLKESFVGMLLSIADTGSITSLVSVLNTVVGGITSVVDAFGSLKGVVGNFGVMITSLITIMATCTKGGRDLAGAFTSIVPGVNKAKSALDGLIAKYKQNTVETEKLIKAKKEEISKLSVGSSAYKKAGNELSVLSGKLVLAKAKTVALTVASVALNAAITMGASLLISAGVNALTKWINKTSEAAEASKEFTDSLDSIGDKKLKLDDILNAKTGVEQIKALENELGSLEEGTDAYIETAGKLETAKKNLIGLYGSMTEVIEDETGAKSLNLEATEKLIGKELELAKASATALLERNEIFSSSDIKKEIAEYEKYYKVVTDLRKASNEGYSGSGGYSTKNLDKYIKKMEESKTNLEAYHSALKILGDDVDWATASFNELSRVLDITSNSNFDIVNAQGNIGEAFDATTDSIESQIVSLDKLIEKYSGLNEPIALLEKAISEFAEMGTIHNDTYNSILTSGNAQMIALLGDVNTFASESMKLLEEWKKSRADAAEEIIKSSMQEVAAVKGAVQEEVGAYTEAEVEKTNASINGTNERTQAEADAANTNANTYSNDASNHGNAEQTKSINEANSASNRTQTEANAANTNAGTYANDATNHGNAEGAKVQNEVDSANERINVEALTNEQLEQLYMNNEITFGEYLKGCLEKYKQWALSIWEAAKNLFNKIIFGSKKATDAMTGEDAGEITEELVLPEGIKPSGNTIKPSGNIVKPTGSNYKPISSSGTTSSAVNKNNSNKGSTQKDVENLENLTDRYYYLNNALKVVENQLQSVDTAMESANESKKIGLLDQEIALLYKKKDALEAIRAENNRELNDIRRQLSSNGFRFNSDGSISNYASQIKALTDAANRLTGDAKKNAIDNVKDLVSKINDYTKLLYDDIPDITDKINEMSNAVISSQKEIAEILSKQRDEYIENLEKETDVLKKELEKRKELLKKQWDEEDAQDELKSKQDTLNELEESLAIALREGDSETVKSIREQIAAAQKEINDFIRDAERDYVTDVIDKDIDKLDEDLQDQIDYINKTLGEEELLALVQNGVRDLSNTLNNIGSVTRQVNTSFASVTRTISNDWINALDSFVSKLGAISNLNLGLDIGSILPRGSLAGVGGINITQGNVVIEGNLTEDLLPQVERMIQNSNNELIREINNALTR